MFSNSLETTAFNVAETFRDGNLNSCRRTSWPETWRNLVIELRARAPGHLEEDNERALNKALAGSRGENQTSALPFTQTRVRGKKGHGSPRVLLR